MTIPRDVWFVDLFAGSGGLAFGFSDAGFLPAGAVESDVDAAATYRLNVDCAIEAVDIGEVASWPRVDLVVGGPPCQGFSNLGRRDPGDPRNDLWRDYVRALRETQASVFVMENVPALLKSAQYGFFIREVEALGFDVTATILDAAAFGVPQHRKRVFVVGSRIGRPRFPAPTHGPGLQRFATVRDAFHTPFKLPGTPDGKNWHRKRTGVHPESYLRYGAVPRNGGNRFQMQDALQAQGLGHLVFPCWREHKGATDVFGRLWWDRPAPTIRTEFMKPEKGRYLHPSANRAITVREAARLQSFPDEFVFPESQSMTTVCKQIGNAVPPLLASAIAKEVAEMFGAARGECSPRLSSAS